MKLYPGESSYLKRNNARYVKTGEFRNPNKGEYFLSGAIPCAYLAPNDLSSPYHIARPATDDERRCKCCGREND